MGRGAGKRAAVSDPVVVEPGPYAVAPRPPARLVGEARDYWVRIAGLLVAKRLLTPLHLEALETLCDQWGIYVTLKTWLAEDPSRWTTCAESGFESESAQVRAMGTAHKNLLRLWAHFGLTPHAEARVRPERGPGAKGFDPAAGLMAEAEEKTRHDNEHRPPQK